MRLNKKLLVSNTTAITLAVIGGSVMKDWFNLEKAGWVVKWYKDYPSDYRRLDSEGRWLGALASTTYRVGLSYHHAILEWTEITNQNAYADGCDCCGPPHNFYEDFVEDLHY